METGYADINGAKINYETAGAGHPFVLIHAGIADSRMWDKQFHVFAEHYKVIRYDQRGFGKSPMVDGTFARYQDLDALLQHLNIEKAYVMGCSMGGGVAMDFTLAHPDKAAALIMVSSAPSGMTTSDPPPPQWDELVAAFDKDDLEHVSELEMQMWVDGPTRTPTEVNPEIRKLAWEMNLIALQQEKTGLGEEQSLEPSAYERLDELKLPTLIIYGDLDRPKPLAAGELMAEKITGAQKVIMPGTAHLPNLERPDDFNQHVLNFLSNL
jgi:pimeloyl-ACP methyl ester carboxylesterase